MPGDVASFYRDCPYYVLLCVRMINGSSQIVGEKNVAYGITVLLFFKVCFNIVIISRDR